VLDDHLKKLHSALEVMISNRKELCSNTTAFVKSVATLGNVEENNSVSRALSRLSEVEEKVESLHQEQLQSDLFVFGETVKDYISLLASIKVTFDFRVKAYNSWQSAQNTLTKKRESEMKLQAGGKQEKIAQIQQEIKEVMKGVARWWTMEWRMGCTRAQIQFTHTHPHVYTHAHHIHAHI